ncbi:hypothetical protein HOP50_17g80900 [Chloropicon primus]|nr:hypothetical protein HOP50_17g80900 [Chloropicon primus]
MNVSGNNNHRSMLENLDTKGNYEEVPAPAEVRDVQQYIDRVLKIITTTFEYSILHWSKALENDKVKDFLRKTAAVKHILKVYAKKDDTIALLEVGKLIILFSSNATDTRLHQSKPQILTKYLRTVISELKSESEYNPGVHDRGSAFAMKLLRFILQRLTAHVLRATLLPKQAESSMILIVLEIWELMKMGLIFPDYESNIEILSMFAGMLEKWRDVPLKRTLSKEDSSCMHKSLQAMHMLIKRMYEQNPKILESGLYPQVHLDLQNLEKKVHIMCGHWTKLSIVPSTHGKLPPPSVAATNRNEEQMAN